jgi:iron-sulfur cluster assembly accessory protein
MNTVNLTVSLSDNAARHIAQLAALETTGHNKFRVSVEGGGCSGFKYCFGFVEEEQLDDFKIEQNGAIVLIDDMSLGFMQGSIIDFVETLGSSGFEVKNPKASASCGCGNSFAV